MNAEYRIMNEALNSIQHSIFGVQYSTLKN